MRGKGTGGEPFRPKNAKCSDASGVLRDILPNIDKLIAFLQIIFFAVCILQASLHWHNLAIHSWTSYKWCRLTEVSCRWLPDSLQLSIPLTTALHLPVSLDLSLTSSNYSVLCRQPSSNSALEITNRWVSLPEIGWCISASVTLQICITHSLVNFLIQFSSPASCSSHLHVHSILHNGISSSLLGLSPLSLSNTSERLKTCLIHISFSPYRLSIRHQWDSSRFLLDFLWFLPREHMRVRSWES